MDEDFMEKMEAIAGELVAEYDLTVLEVGSMLASNDSSLFGMDWEMD